MYLVHLYRKATTPTSSPPNAPPPPPPPPPSSSKSQNVLESKPSPSAGPAPGDADSRQEPRAGTQQEGGPIPRGFGRIVRDEDGNVVDVILADEDDADEAEEGGSGAMEMDRGRYLGEDSDEDMNPLDRRQPESLPGADWLLPQADADGIHTDLTGAAGPNSKPINAVVRGKRFRYCLLLFLLVVVPPLPLSFP